MRGLLGRYNFVRQALKLVAVIAVVSVVAVFIINVKNRSNALAEVSSDVWELSTAWVDTETNTTKQSENWQIDSETTGAVNHIFTLQVNYKAERIDKDYAPGDLSIVVNTPFNGLAADLYGTLFHDEVFNQDVWLNSLSIAKVSYSAKPVGSSSEVDYDWEYRCSGASSTNGIVAEPAKCTFTNLKSFSEGTSIEGAFQMTYSVNSVSVSDIKPPFFLENAAFTYDNTIKATLNNTVESQNSATVHYDRTYNINWTKEPYRVYVEAEKIDSYEGLGADASDYIWVHYYYLGQSWSSPEKPMMTFDPDTSVFSDYSSFRSNRKIPVKSWYWQDALNHDVKVLDANKNEMSRNAAGNYIVSNAGYTSSAASCNFGYYAQYSKATCQEVYVGYPRDKYASEIQNETPIKNTVYSKGVYFKETDESDLDDDDAEVVLGEFDLEYHGDDVGVDKSVRENRYVSESNADPWTETERPYSVNSADIKSEDGGSIYFNISSKSVNTSAGAYDLVIGDDILFYEDTANASSTKERLDDNDYHFASIMAPGVIKGSNGARFACRENNVTRYHADVYYRLRGESEYRQLDTNKDYACGSYLTWDFDSNEELKGKVVGWRVEVKNLDRDVVDYKLSTKLVLQSSSLPENGKVYNFSYIEMRRNGSLVNTAEFENYAEGITRTKIAPYDMSTYGHYQQRWFAEYAWEGYSLGDIFRVPGDLIYESTSPVFDNSSDGFIGAVKAYSRTKEYSDDGVSDPALFIPLMSDSDFITNLYSIVMLPSEVIVRSTPDEIIESMYLSQPNDWTTGVYDKQGNALFESAEDALEFVKNHATVTIVPDYHERGYPAVQISVDFSTKPFTRLNKYDRDHIAYNFSYIVKYKIPYESYVERPTRTYYFYDYGVVLSPGCEKEGASCSNRDSSDFNDNGILTEIYNIDRITTSVLLSQAAEQSMKELVKTDQTIDFSTEDSYVTLGGDYEYKLAARTGMSRATNIVTYDNLETAHGDNAYWQGTFDGVDVSYANGRKDFNGNDIQVKVWYSTNANAGSFGSDSSWREYVEGTTNKSSVKSIAFEYLTTDGSKAELGASDYIYTIIKMKAPTEGGRDSYAYNAFRSEWNAIDASTGMVVPDVVGVGSNTTRVLIDHPITVRVVKKWVDYDNKYLTRPATVNPVLKRGSIIEDDSKTIATAVNGASTEYNEDLHEYYKDNYDVTLAAIPNYTTTKTKTVDGDVITFTFESTLRLDNITVKKVWVDFDNFFRLRPDGVKFDLMYNNASEDDHTMNIASNESQFVFSGVPSHLIRDHSVAMTPFSDYYTTTLSVSSDGRTYTFTSVLNVDTIKVIHNWDDEDDILGARPDIIGFNLIWNYYPNGENNPYWPFPLDTSNGENTANFEIPNVGTGVIDQFEVQAIPFDYYDTTLTSHDTTTHTFTFTSVLRNFDIHVVNEWIDDDNLIGKRPESLNFLLNYEGETEVEHEIDTEENVETFDFATLFEYKKPGYGVVLEEEPEGYETTWDFNEDTMTYTFTHTLKKEPIKVVHIWDDEDNILGARPETLDFTLTRGDDYLVDTHELDVTEDEDNFEFEDIPTLIIDEFGVELDPFEFYDTTYEYDEETRTYTFTSVLRNFDIHVINIWKDNDNELGERPDSLKFDLVYNRETEKSNTITTENAEEKFDFETLFEFKKPGYTVKLEEEPNGYETSFEFDEETMTFKFIHTIIPKPEVPNTEDNIVAKAAIFAAVAAISVGGGWLVMRRRR